MERERLATLLYVLALAAFVAVFIVNAWMVDDAYITLRTVDNLTHGHGLRWNTHERVQVFTHPLWLFVLAAFYALTSEAFYTTLAVSLACCLAAFAVYRRSLAPPDRGKAALLVVFALTSKAFMDYTSSGMENPLSFLLLAVFFSRYLSPSAETDLDTPGQLSLMTLIASLLFLNRQDTLLLVLPALGGIFVPVWRRHPRRPCARAPSASFPPSPGSSSP